MGYLTMTEEELKKEGVVECPHCNGYGSSLQDSGDGRCSMCGGSGLLKKIKREDKEDSQKL